MRDVKVLGLVSKNGRRYLAEAARRALPLYDNSPVYLDHPPADKAGECRPFAEAFGRITSPHMSASGIRGSLQVQPRTPLRQDVFAWWAKNDPARVGLSHNAVGEGTEEDGILTVDNILEVHSVDLVTSPATTRGLSEGTTVEPEDMLEDPMVAPEGGEPGYAEHLGNMVVAILSDPSMDAATKKKKVLQALKMLDDNPAASDGAQAVEDEVVEDEDAELDEACDDEDLAMTDDDKKKKDATEAAAAAALAAGTVALSEASSKDPAVIALQSKLETFELAESTRVKRATARKQVAGRLACRRARSARCFWST